MAGIVAFGLLATACADQPIPGAKAELEQFQADPAAKFRAPGTKLIGDSKVEGIVRFNNEETVTRLDQAFSMTGDPGETVDAYRVVAEAAGWTRRLRRMLPRRAGHGHDLDQDRRGPVRHPEHPGRVGLGP